MQSVHYTSWVETGALSEWWTISHQADLDLIPTVAYLYEHHFSTELYFLSMKDVVIHSAHAVRIAIWRPAHQIEQSFAYSISHVNSWPFIMLDNFMDEFFFHCNINQEQIKYEKRGNQNAVYKGCFSSELFWINIIQK